MAIVTETPSPMGWYYSVEGGDKPYINRCKIGFAWERAEVYELTDMTAEELRFLADLIDRHKESHDSARP